MKTSVGQSIIPGVAMSLALSLVAVSGVQAALSADSELTQAITAGVISTDIRNSSDQVVSSPSFAMTAVAASTSQQTATGTFGTVDQRISVDDSRGNGNSWTLALNAKTPGTGTWVSGGDSYKYNGATAGEGQLTINPAAGAITDLVGGSTGVTRGTSATFTGSNPITIMSANASASKLWNGYITGIGLSQTIPAAQPLGSYSIDMTQTITAT